MALGNGAEMRNVMALTSKQRAYLGGIIIERDLGEGRHVEQDVRVVFHIAGRHLGQVAQFLGQHPIQIDAGDYLGKNIDDGTFRRLEGLLRFFQVDVPLHHHRQGLVP